MPVPIGYTHNKSQGFSILELLVVMAVMATLVGLTVQNIGPLMTARNFDSSVSSTGMMLEEARAAAIAKDTYVWVGLHNQTQGGMAMLMLYSPSGRSSDLALGQAQPLAKPVVMPTVQLISLSHTALPNANLATFSVADFVTASGQTSFTTPDSGAVSYNASIGGVPVAFSNFIEVSPEGRAAVASQLSAWIQLGFQNLHGNQKEQAIIQMSGLNGKVATYYP